MVIMHDYSEIVSIIENTGDFATEPIEILYCV